MEVDQTQISIHKGFEAPHTDSEAVVFVIDRKDEDKLLLALIQEMFKRKVFESDSEFQKWLKRHDIEYEFSSYA